MHQHLVNRQAMKPGSEGTFTSKASQLAKNLYENVLCQIFSLSGISNHSQTKGIDSPVIEPEDLLKGLRAAAINGITAEHISLGWKRFFHLVCPPKLICSAVMPLIAAARSPLRRS